MNRRFRKLLWVFLLIITIVLSTLQPIQGRDVTEVLWDTWGVPHIYANNNENLYRAFGWSQTKSHGNLILRLYGQSRGRAAEYWGENFLQSDEYVRTMGIPERGKEWYAQQNPSIRKYLDAFAEGINSYVKANPDEVDKNLKVVLPITGADILAHIQRVIHFYFIFNPSREPLLSQENTTSLVGSNGWAISPSYSESGNALLLGNPHLPWTDFFLWYEAQLKSPDTNAYGAALVGWPVLGIAFNDNLGWTFTVNTLDGSDIYELTLGEKGYEFDGKIRPFQKVKEIIKIRQEDGTVKNKELIINHSVHGPVIKQANGKALAVRVIGLNRPNIIEQFWSMAKAKNRLQFESALKLLQLPMFNVLYADIKGQILYVFNALVPRRSLGDWSYWQKLIPGNTSDTLWNEYHNYQDLPKVLNPATGWIQNANDPPWTSTYPSILNPNDYPSYLAPSSLGKMGNKRIFRPQRSIKMLQEDDQISFEEMIDKKFSSRIELADRILDDLISVGQTDGSELALKAVEVLKKWDRQANANSRGTMLFYQWVQKMNLNNLFTTDWNPQQPLSTPKGLADPQKASIVLEEVASELIDTYGKLDISWGEVARMIYGKQNLPASGAFDMLGSFQVLNFKITSNNLLQVIYGDSFIMAVEFSKPLQAKVLNVLGNETQPDSYHIGDQLYLYAQEELRPVWRSRKEVLLHLEDRVSI